VCPPRRSARSADRVTVVAPLTARWVEAALELDGWWAETPGAFRFEMAAEPAVRGVVRRLFGTEDGPAVIRVRVHVALGWIAGASGSRELVVEGQRICWRERARDAVQLAPGVRIVQGAFGDAGGTPRRPRLGEVDGVVVELDAVDPDVAAMMVARYAAACVVIPDVPLGEWLEVRRMHLEDSLAAVKGLSQSLSGADVDGRQVAGEGSRG